MASWLRSIAEAFTGVPSEGFNTWLADNYEDIEPSFLVQFFPGSFMAALKACANERRLLLVWLHNAKGPLTDALVRQVWVDPSLLRHVAGGRLLCWAGDVCRAEPGSLANKLRVQQFPALALLRPIVSNSLALSGHAVGDRPFAVHFVVPVEVGPRRIFAELNAVLQREVQEQQLRTMVQDMAGQLQRQQQEQQAMQQRMELLRRQEEEEAPLLVALYESQYAGGHPEFCEKSFEGAMAEARKEGRVLLAWLRAPSKEPEDAAFGTSIWPDEVVQGFVAEHFVLWVGDVDRWHTAYQLRNLLQLTEDNVPALVAFRPMSVNDVNDFAFMAGGAGGLLDGCACEYPAGTAWQVLTWLGATAALDEGAVVDFLNSLSDRWDAERVAQELERQERLAEQEAWRELREQQDAEYEASLQVDKERARQQEIADLAAAEAAQAAAQQAEQPHREVEQPVEEAVSALELRRREAAARLLEVPEPSSGACTIVVRLPSGGRIQRRFPEDETLAVIYDWVDCAAELQLLRDAASASGESSEDVWAKPLGFRVPSEFMLCVTFPRQALTDRGVTLRAAGLSPNALLALLSSE